MFFTATRAVGPDAMIPDKAIKCNGSLSLGLSLYLLSTLFEN